MYTFTLSQNLLAPCPSGLTFVTINVNSVMEKWVWHKHVYMYIIEYLSDCINELKSKNLNLQTPKLSGIACYVKLPPPQKNKNKIQGCSTEIVTPATHSWLHHSLLISVTVPLSSPTVPLLPPPIAVYTTYVKLRVPIRSGGFQATAIEKSVLFTTRRRCGADGGTVSV